MKQRIKLLITSALVVAFATLGLISPLATSSVTAAPVVPGDAAKNGLNAAGGGGTKPNELKVQVKNVVNVLLFILGAIAVIMIVLGGIRYTLSNGDASQIKGAKDTILYSIVGLVVALLAFAIVNFVINQFS